MVLVLVTLGVGLPLLLGRVLAGHDVVVYLINAQQTAANLRAGEIFPAWGGDFTAGYGSPVLLFFPPLTSYVDALPALLGIPIISGLGVLALVAHLVSGLAVLGWLRSLGLRHAALPAAIVYAVAPYRLIDMYQRTALAEHWAFIWPPLILWVAGSRRPRPILQVPLLGLLVAALLLSNLPLAVLFGIGLAVWFLVSERLGDRRLRVAAGATLGFALASFALVPQVLASLYLAVDLHYGAAAGSLRPSANTLFSSLANDRGFNTTVSIALLATSALALVAFFLLPSSARRLPGTRLLILGALGCVLAATAPAGPLWDVLPVLSRLQFPWRVAAPLTLVAAALVGRLEGRRAWLLALVGVIAALPFSGWGWTLPRATFTVQKPLPTAPGTVFPDPHATWEANSGGTYWVHENLADIWFLPRTMKAFVILDLAGTPARELNAIRSRPAVLLEDPSAPVRVVSWGPVQREIEISTPTGGTLIWRAIAFPEMRARVDGREVEVSTDPTTGLLAHFVPAGSHAVEWSWQPFPALRLARGVTVAALLLTLFLMVAAAVGRPRTW